MDRVFELLNYVENPKHKNNLILDLCRLSLNANLNEESLKFLKHYISEFNPNKKIPALFFELVGQTGGNELLKYSYNLLRDSDENTKPVLMKYLIKGMVKKSEYYLAMSIIPTNISSNSELAYINELLSINLVKDKQKIERPWLKIWVNWSDQIYEDDRNGNIVYF